MAKKLSISIQDPERGKEPAAASCNGAENFRAEFDQRRLTRDLSGDGVLCGTTCLTAHTLADIAHIGGKDRFVVHLVRGNSQLDLQSGTVRAQSRHFDAPAQ